MELILNENLLRAFGEQNLEESERELKFQGLEKDKDYRFLNHIFTEHFISKEKSNIYMRRNEPKTMNSSVNNYLNKVLKINIYNPTHSQTLFYTVDKLQKKILLKEEELFKFFKFIKDSFDQGIIYKSKNIEDFYYNGGYIMLDLDKVYLTEERNIRLNPSRILYNELMYFYNNVNTEYLFNLNVTKNILHEEPVVEVFPILAIPQIMNQEYNPMPNRIRIRK